MPSDYCYAEKMREVLADLLENHPLGGNILTDQVRSQLTVCVDINSTNIDVDPEIDCKGYPSVRIRFGLSKYHKDWQFDKELFYKHMCHELTHLIDRLDGNFAITCKKEECAKNISSGFLPLIHVDLWNLYINGRLWRKGVEVECFEDFKQKRFSRRCMGEAALDPYRKAWDSDKLSFDELKVLAKQARSLLTSCH